jgi:hypothetical protein
LELGDDDWLGFFERASVAPATAMVTAASSAVSAASSAVPSSVSTAMAMLGPVQIDVDLSSSFFNGCGKGHQTNECDLIIYSKYNQIKLISNKL